MKRYHLHVSLETLLGQFMTSIHVSKARSVLYVSDGGGGGAGVLIRSNFQTPTRSHYTKQKHKTSDMLYNELLLKAQTNGLNCHSVIHEVKPVIILKT